MYEQSTRHASFVYSKNIIGIKLLQLKLLISDVWSIVLTKDIKRATDWF